MKQPDRLMAYRLLDRAGRIDVDAFFESITESQWQEYVVAKTINDSHDDWVEAVRNGYKKAWNPPVFETSGGKSGKRKRRRLDGSEY